MVKAHANLRVRERGSRGKAFWALDFMFLLPESAWAKRHPEAAGHGAKGKRTPRHSRRTGLDKQKKEGEKKKEKSESVKCKETKGGKRKTAWRKQKAGGGPSRQGGSRSKGWGIEPKIPAFIFKSSRCLRVK